MSDDRQFRALYDANRARVLSLLTRMAGPQEAEDLSQIVFAKASEAWSGFRGDADPATWVHRIAVNVALDCLRSRSAKEQKVTDALPADAALVDGSDPEQELAHKDVRACMLEDIERLSGTHREVFLLNALAGLGEEEIDRMTGLSRGNVKVRLSRAREEFRRIVGARCEFYCNEFACKPSNPDCCAPPPPGR
jgi:RNA polymerase sigma-70 factor (ECF subfamily)